MSAMAAQIIGVSIVCSTACSAKIKENTKAPRRGSLWGETTGDQWIPLTKGQSRGKYFHLMTSSCDGPSDVIYLRIVPVAKI